MKEKRNIVGVKQWFLLSKAMLKVLKDLFISGESSHLR